MNADQTQLNEMMKHLEHEIAEGRGTRTMAAKLERLKRERQQLQLGRLARLFDRSEFRDDVLYSARLRGRPKTLAECLEDPQWATIQRLDLVEASLPELEGRSGAFFNSMPLLTTLENLHPRLLPEAPCPRITSLSMPHMPVAPLAAAFPALRSLEFVNSIADPGPLWADPFIRALDSMTLRSLTWSQGILTARAGFSRDAFVAWIENGPPLTRMEVCEDELLESGELYGLQDFLAAVRRKGAEVVLMPGQPRPPPRWLS
jgi:hypothetical protein